MAVQLYYYNSTHQPIMITIGSGRLPNGVMKDNLDPAKTYILKADEIHFIPFYNEDYKNKFLNSENAKRIQKQGVVFGKENVFHDIKGKTYTDVAKLETVASESLENHNKEALKRDELMKGSLRDETGNDLHNITQDEVGFVGTIEPVKAPRTSQRRAKSEVRV